MRLCNEGLLKGPTIVCDADAVHCSTALCDMDKGSFSMPRSMPHSSGEVDSKKLGIE